MTLKKTMYVFYFLSFLAMPLGFLIRIFYSKTLGISDFGLIYAIISFFTLISIIVQMGLDQSIIYFLPKFIENKEFEKIRNSFFSVITTLFVTNTILVISILLLVDYLEKYYFKIEGSSVIILIFLGYIVINNLLVPITQFFLAFKKITYSQNFYIIRLSLILLFSFFFYSVNFDNLIYYYSLTWLSILFLSGIIYILFLVCKFPFLTEKIPKFDFNLLKQFFTYGLYGMFSGVSSMIIAQIDIILITYFFTVSQVSLYSNMIAIIGILFLLMTPISILFLPLFSEYKEKNNYEFMRKIVSYLYKYGFYLILPISIIFFIYSKQIISLIFSRQYIEAYVLLQILSLFSIFKILFQYNLNFMNGLGLIKKTTIIIFSVSIFNLIFNMILLKFFGLIGIALVTGFSWMLLFFFTTYYIKREINFQFKFFILVKILFLNFLFFIFLFFIKNIYSIKNTYLNISLILIFSFSIYIILGYFLKIYTLEEINFFLPDSIKNIFNIYFKK